MCEKLCSEEIAIIEARRRYKKQWREKNRDKIEAANKRFYLKQSQKQEPK